MAIICCFLVVGSIRNIITPSLLYYRHHCHASKDSAEPFDFHAHPIDPLVSFGLRKSAIKISSIFHHLSSRAFSLSRPAYSSQRILYTRSVRARARVSPGPRTLSLPLCPLSVGYLTRKTIILCAKPNLYSSATMSLVLVSVKPIPLSDDLLLLEHLWRKITTGNEAMQIWIHRGLI